MPLSFAQASQSKIAKGPFASVRHLVNKFHGAMSFGGLSVRREGSAIGSLCAVIIKETLARLARPIPAQTRYPGDVSEKVLAQQLRELVELLGKLSAALLATTLPLMR